MAVSKIRMHIIAGNAGSVERRTSTWKSCAWHYIVVEEAGMHLGDTVNFLEYLTKFAITCCPDPEQRLTTSAR
jgi:hypothetical protein